LQIRPRLDAQTLARRREADGVVGVEMVDLRPPEGRKGVRPPLAARPVLWLVSAALDTDFLGLGLRLADPGRLDRMGPRWAGVRAQLRQRHGADVFIPVARKLEDARDILEIVRGRARIGPTAEG
jgi:hypothetical protein